MALTDTSVRHAKPRAKDYTLPDLNGLAFFVNTNGAKRWRFRFFWADKQPVFLSVPILKLEIRYCCMLTIFQVRGVLSPGSNP
ncbi:Arm DNA-binding domain-containing protein [Pseudomonas poae]|uniref:Arm DNA-binding domain-containing protein n=1 Tax=Pseudomonas poae TaxID=200451 RepID=UPI0021CCA018|nr:Arm DNA-binding domain-containing protein [Pseudomonas poae]